MFNSFFASFDDFDNGTSVTIKPKAPAGLNKHFISYLLYIVYITIDINQYRESLGFPCMHLHITFQRNASNQMLPFPLTITHGHSLYHNLRPSNSTPAPSLLYLYLSLLHPLPYSLVPSPLPLLIISYK